MVVIEAQEAWWPPTFSPSRLFLRWLALWIVQVDSQRSRSSSRFRRQTVRSAVGAVFRLARDIGWRFPCDPAGLSRPQAEKFAKTGVARRVRGRFCLGSRPFGVGSEHAVRLAPLPGPGALPHHARIVLQRGERRPSIGPIRLFMDGHVV